MLANLANISGQTPTSGLFSPFLASTTKWPVQELPSVIVYSQRALQVVCLSPSPRGLTDSLPFRVSVLANLANISGQTPTSGLLALRRRRPSSFGIPQSRMSPFCISPKWIGREKQGKAKRTTALQSASRKSQRISSERSNLISSQRDLK